MSLIDSLSLELGQYLQQQNLTVTTAESCTGGAIAQAITNISGSSAWFSHGFITYSNQAKQELLDLSPDLFIEQGAVSQAVVEAMAAQALTLAHADLSVAVSGIAGPNGGSPEKPVGTVWIAWATVHQPVISQRFQFDGDRKSIRNQTVIESLKKLIKMTKNTV